MATSRFTIPARRGKVALVRQGQHVRVINTHGQQVIDTWAFNRTDLTECMSLEHVRTALGRIMVRVGDALVTTRRRPILRLLEDTSPGVHDTLLAACDRYRYELLGCTTYHDNCTDNLTAALAESEDARQIFAGANWSAAISNPFRHFNHLHTAIRIIRGEMDRTQMKITCFISFC